MSKLRVLLLENDANDAFIVQRELRDVATVDVAITGQMFREMLHEKWDCVLCDLALPDIQGTEAIQLAKSTHQDTPVIIITGAVSAKEADEACNAGAARFFMKSVGGLPGLARAVVQAHEMAQLQHQLVKDNRMEILGHTTAGFTHDLNNILHIVVNGPDILRRELSHYRLLKLPEGQTSELPESMERILGAMESSGRRGADMSRQITTFVRGSNGSSLKIVKPEFILTELGKLLRDSFPKNIRLSFLTLPGTSGFKCDATQIEQLLMNLAVNARDAMPHGGDLTVLAQNVKFGIGQPSTLNPQPATSLTGDYVMIEVRDTGTGIKPQILERIFEPFFTTKEIGKGTGLGLSMAKKIASDHHGDIDVRTGPEGTSFYVYLPQAKTETHAQTIKRAEAFNGQGRVVLVVDDEAHMRMFLEMHLRDSNYRPLIASSGMEAISYFRSNQNIAIILTDVGMPVMSGIDLADFLRAQPFDLPIIFLTGATDMKTFNPAPDAVLEKPFTREDLLSTIARLTTQ